MKPHKHAKEIKAWADGAEIEYLTLNGKWLTSEGPSWGGNTEYRIKPQPKPDVVYYGNFELATPRNYFLDCCFTLEKESIHQIKITIDGETGKLKSAEVLK
jgi:hypothetical protein